jgi:hypothetical protein
MPPEAPVALEQLNKRLEVLLKTREIVRCNLEALPRRLAKKYSLHFQILTGMIDGLRRKITLEYPLFVHVIRY